MELLMRALLFVMLLAGGCFDVQEPPCAYACGPNGECPDDYSCGTDNYCHLHGTGICSFSDASFAPDLSVPENLPDAAMDLTEID
jgi:hypothetical protein